MPNAPSASLVLYSKRLRVSLRWLLLPASLAITVAMPIAVHAQTPEAREWKAGGGYFAVGIQHLGANDLNDRFAEAGHPTLSRVGLTVGGGGYNSRGRWRIGGEGHGILGRGREESEFATDVSGGYGLFTVGYSVPGVGRVALVPEFGIGGGGLTATITEREAGTFDKVLADPRRGVRLSRGALLTSVGVVAHFSLGDALMGIRAGYLLPLAQSSWTTDGAPISGGSSFTSQGAFLRLTIGGGGRSPSNPKTQEVTR